MKTELHYFVNSNGCEGFYSLFRSNFGRMQTVLQLGDYPMKTLETVVNAILEEAEQNDCQVEIVHNCLDNTVEGLLLPQFSTGIVNIPLYIDYGYPVQKLMYDDAVEKTRQHLLRSHQYFCEAKEIHDRWERIYTENTDYDALNDFTKEQISLLLEGKQGERRGRVVHRFFGAATENGPVDWIEDLTARIGRRVFIKGRPGTGKSTFLKKLSDQAVAAGFDTEIYHCAFDPFSLDMVIVRDLDLCVFDSTSPHEYFPDRETDTVLDFYAAAVREDTDKRFEETLQTLKKQYQNQMEQACSEIAEANRIRLEREAVMQGRVRAEKTEEITAKIRNKLFLKKQ